MTRYETNSLNETKPWIKYTSELPSGKEYKCVSCTKYFYPPNIKHIDPDNITNFYTWDNRCLQCLELDYIPPIT